MARLLENQVKDLLKDVGVKVPRYAVANSAEETKDIVAGMGKEVVLKALLPLGKKGKAGAVKFAVTPEEAYQKAKELLGQIVHHYPVEQVLIEERIVIAQEMYAAIVIDYQRRLPVIMVSKRGGMEIEELARAHPEEIISLPVEPGQELAAFKARELWSDLGLKGKVMVKCGDFLKALYRLFLDCDAYLLEINPLAITQDEEVVAVGALMGLDDNALWRHPHLNAKIQMGMERAWRPLTALEKQAVEVNEAEPYRGTARYTEIDGGDIGFMCGGGGGSLMLYDALLHFGGRPANYTEFGGNPSENKVCGLAKVILSKPGVKGLFVGMNITNNTQVDLVVKGIIRALEEKGVDLVKFPVVIREAGINEAEARRLCAEVGLEYYGEEITLTQAAQRMVEKMREIYGNY